MSQQEMFDPIGGDPFEVAQAGVADLMQARHRWPQRLAELYDVEFAYNQRRHGMDEAAAERDAAERVFLLASYVGGRLMYIPSSEKLRVAIRDLQIFRAAGKRSVYDLAREHVLTHQQIYNIIGEHTRLVRDRLQGKLFE